MSGLGPAAVEEEVRRLARKLEQRTDELADLFQKAAEADVAYRVRFAVEVKRSDGSAASDREADATVACQDLLRERKITEARADACRESVRSMRDQLSAVQSVGAMVRAQMQLGSAA